MQLAGTSSLNLLNGTQIINAQGGLFDVQSNVIVKSTTNDGSITNQTGGTFQQSAGSGTTSISVPVTNAGTISASVGTLAFNSGGTSNAGTFTASNGAAVLLNSNWAINSGTQFTAADTATVTAAAPLTLRGNSANSGNFVLGPTGSLTGSGMLTNAGTFTWSGSIDSGVTLANSGAGTVLVMPANNTVLGGAVNNQGHFNISGGTSSTYPLNVATSGTFINSGTIAFTGDNNYLSPLQYAVPQAMMNTGTIAKTAGAGTSTVNLTLTSNGGTIDAESGTLTFNGTATVTGGTLKSGSSGTLAFNGSSLTLGNGVAVNGAGSGGVNFNGPLVVNGSVALSGHVIANYGPVSGTGSLTNAGTFDLANTTTAQLTGGITNDAGGIVNWAGTISGGTITNYASSSVTQAEGIYLNSNVNLFTPTIRGNATFTNYGTANLSGGGSFRDGGTAADSGTIQNYGTFTVTDDSGMFGPTFVNQQSGTFTKSGGVSSNIATRSFTNTGTVNVNAGELQFNGVGTSSGTFNTSAGTTITFGNYPTPWSLTGGSFNGTGTVKVQTNVSVSGSVNASTGFAVNSGNLTIASGGTLTLAQPLNHNSGTVNLVNGGTLAAPTIASTADFEFSGGTLNANFDNKSGGHLHITGGGTRTVNGSVINEAGGVIKTAGTAFAYTGTFTNNGSYQSDPADNFFTDLVIGPSGILGGSYGDRFFVSGNFSSASTKSHEWDTRHADLLFVTSPAHTISVNGIDLGPTDGYADNFAWGTLALTPGETLFFTDGNQTPGGALYIGTLALGGGLPQLANIHGNGMNLYYDPAMAGNAYLLDQTYALAGGGQLLPASAFASVPEPASTIFLSVILGGFAIGRRR